MSNKASRDTSATSETALVKSPGVVQDSDLATLDAMFEAGFSQEQTISIGDPTKPNKVRLYFGELLGPGPIVLAQRPGTKPNPVTGEVEMSELPTYLFNPLDPKTFEAFRKRLDTVICAYQVAQACRKYESLARARGGVAHILFRWNGKVETNRGNQMNDVSTVYRIIDPKTGEVLMGGTSAVEDPANAPSR